MPVEKPEIVLLFSTYIIYYLNPFGWHCEAERMVRLFPSHLHVGIDGLGLENPIE